MQSQQHAVIGHFPLAGPKTLMHKVEWKFPGQSINNALFNNCDRRLTCLLTWSALSFGARVKWGLGFEGPQWGKMPADLALSNLFKYQSDVCSASCLPKPSHYWNNNSIRFTLGIVHIPPYNYYTTTTILFVNKRPLKSVNTFPFSTLWTTAACVTNSC